MAWVSRRIVARVAYFGSGGNLVVVDDCCDCDDIVVEDVDCWCWDGDDDDVAAWVDDSMIIFLFMISIVVL